jgi:hypothetical protein
VAVSSIETVKFLVVNRNLFFEHETKFIKNENAEETEKGEKKNTTTIERGFSRYCGLTRIFFGLFSPHFSICRDPLNPPKSAFYCRLSVPSVVKSYGPLKI